MAKKEENNCVHCGADCGSNPVVWNELNFCCTGCKTVYQLLNENKLYNYYKLEETPGIKVETTTEFGNKYAFLDNDEVKEKLISFSEGSISKVKFYVPVIHCASCIWLLEHLHKLHKGIRHSFVNFTRKEVDITFDEKEISLRQVVELLASIHYIPDLSQSLSDKKDDKSYKKLLYKIGVAGFVFVNVMTYSLPAYFNGEPLSDKLQSLFSILSYILVIPVAFYSGSDYYISAIKNLMKKNISIDLPIALGIIVLFLVTSYEVIFTGGPGYSDSLSG
ncbi:heavy metal translocating P-type ATPase metal-binding domain-containing protein, partial [Draconibacterium sp.]|uniref:heavy metal translocating P-type ATPase metal-binding domain-containing protein n=1 Tax=Draconibacterium sp. TaxID=1965318 RepID=UPI003565A084